MKNPLKKRILREFIGDFSKYAAVFLFMTATIGFVSGFLVASGSMVITYDESFERYNIEDGHFVIREEAGEELLSRIEKEDVTLYEDYYQEVPAKMQKDASKEFTVRLYGERSEVNKTCLLDGTLPDSDNQVALDRLFMKNNGIVLGDNLQLYNQLYEIVGVVALPDYSAAYQNNNDLMFDSSLFGVGVLSEGGFEKLGDLHKKYCYAWEYNTPPKDEDAQRELFDDLMPAIYKACINESIDLDIMIPEYGNRSIHFAGDDMGSDRPMMTILLYILVAIMAFVFAVTINHTVAREATVIGTLRASGYTKMELFSHYIACPILVTVLSAILGNVLGYTVFVGIARDMYLGSYALTTYVSYWNADAFVKTTVGPTMIMLAVTSISLWRKLAFSPLQFLRRDISKSKRTKAVKLPHIRFFARFQLRIILQNMSSYLTLFVGIVFATLILMFGFAMRPLLDDYAVQAIEHMPAKYQYMLETEQEVDRQIAEPYCITSLKMLDDFYDEEEVNLYGFVEDSQYYDLELPEEGVIVTSDFAKKYCLKENDIINLKEIYGNKIYAFRVKGIFDYPTCLGVFMSQEYYNDVFEDAIEKEADSERAINMMLDEMTEHKSGLYYNGYFSNERLEGTYLREDNVASVITEDDLTKFSRQMDISMGRMFGLVGVFAVVLFALLIFLLTKLILEKNTNSISMVKILGYRNDEISRLYLMSSVWVVVISAIVSLAFNTWLFSLVIRIFLKGYGGWFNLVIAPSLYLKMFLLMLGTYLVVAATQILKIRKIPMDEALKNVE